MPRGTEEWEITDHVSTHIRCARSLLLLCLSVPDKDIAMQGVGKGLVFLFQPGFNAAKV